MVRLTAKERILLHLLDYTKYQEAIEVPPEMTQEGLASAAWVELRHLSQYLRPLLAEELVRERTSHVRGIRQRRKVYDLTDKGSHSSYRLRDRAKAETVRVHDARGVREEAVAKVLEVTGGKIPLLELVRQSMQTGTIDLDALSAVPAGPTVERLAEAPRLDRFVGRRAELEAITADGEGPRIFVVRGVAGIGKSSVAAKACELLRGSRNLFWHTLRPWDTRASVLTALGEFLSALGKPGLRSLVTRGEASEATRVLREDLPGTQSLLVFDDAHEAATDVLALFRFLKDAVAEAPDVRVLILTRRTLAFYDRRDVAVRGLVKEIDLGGLSTEDIAAFLAPRMDVASANLGRELGGHPLFLQLVRSAAHPAARDHAVSDMGRFLEEEVYAQLSESERKALKTASLYRVPVPREALHSDPSVTHDVLLSLTNRSLLRPVGMDALEVHDTIRSFFAGVLTPAEKEAIGRFARTQLGELASKAREERNLVACIDYLSNALQLSDAVEERAAILEILGDADEKIGDFPAALTVYKEAAKATESLEKRARLHRKTASALEARGEITTAAKEIEAGRQTLGDAVNVERGWLDLVASRVAGGKEDWERAREAGQSALDIFENLRDVPGLVRTLYQLAYIEVEAQRGDSTAAEQYFLTGLDLARDLGDPELAAKLHTGMAHLYAARAGNVKGAMEHMAAVEAIPEALQDPQVQRSFVMLQAWFHLDIRADFPTAERYFAEAESLARKIHFASSVAFARYGLALSVYYLGGLEEARRRLEEFAADILARGFPAYAVEALLVVAECDLRMGDLQDFQRVVRELSRPELAEGRNARPVRMKVLEAVDALLTNDLEKARDKFDEALRLAGEGVVLEEAFLLHFVHFYCGIALRVCGLRKEGDEHLRTSREFLERYHLKARLSILPDAERELSETLSRAVGKPH